MKPQIVKNRTRGGLRVQTQVRAGIPSGKKATWTKCTQDCDADNRCRYLDKANPSDTDLYNYLSGYAGCVDYWCKGRYELTEASK